MRILTPPIQARRPTLIVRRLLAGNRIHLIMKRLLWLMPILGALGGCSKTLEAQTPPRPVLVQTVRASSAAAANAYIW